MQSRQFGVSIETQREGNEKACEILREICEQNRGFKVSFSFENYIITFYFLLALGRKLKDWKKKAVL